MHQTIKVVGAGLAGCEAAWQAAKMGVTVDLYEMKPEKYTPAHKKEYFAELVCSNSFRSEQPENAIGLLKEELSRTGSLIMEAAKRTRVPAGSALAVDRDAFSHFVTQQIKANPNIRLHLGEEVDDLNESTLTVVATGPLTSDKLAEKIKNLAGGEGLHFYDAAAPIVDGAAINYQKAFFASRYGKGDGNDYLNCPFTKEEYDVFYEALITAETAKLHEFDRDEKALTVFEGCMPIEVMAKRGRDTLLYGPMKPVGLPLPQTGKDAYAVVQLRKENAEGTMFNLVGFQTHLTFPEQKRVFRLIPGLENADFLRFGVMHRNTYLNSPVLLNEFYAVRKAPRLFFAGQMTGVEGYIESVGSGFIAGVNAARMALGKDPVAFPKESMLGAMAYYVSHGGSSAFQPMNANFGIIPPLTQKVKGGKKFRNQAYTERAISALEAFWHNIGDTH
ncbi:MAG: methylenetetrahydrofolate--tRNA-(uracil(54)-C(5))-methyltransferase (FADH(2)-oxidizing) TrmFO [Clostridia bacterium]|nr:methylenetetrahydrofolate--tRNA-(uracil(54)-C(5))-methyltransferase (FADH(2)-oxidizing) TrmFO [Clostridia bacterium]